MTSAVVRNRAMASCPNCRASLSEDDAYCSNCGAALTLVSQHATAQSASIPSASVSERPFTKAEGSTLATVGAGPRSWAGAFGFVNILMGAFAFTESPQDLGSDGATFLAMLTFTLGFIALGAGISARRSRTMAKQALSGGRVVEAHGTVGSASMQASRIMLGNGALEVPRAGRAGAPQGFVGAQVGPEGSRADVVFTKPMSAGVSNVFLLSLNGGALQKAVRCRFMGGGL